MIIINKEFKLLYKNFIQIKEKGWIKSLKKGYAGIGYTFEKLLGKEADNFRIPDYHGIELKTMKYIGRNKINLFSASPDGDTLFPIKRVLNQLGYPDKDYPEYKVLSASANAKEFTSIGYKNIKIKINREKEKIDLLAYNTCGPIYELETSWSFKMIEEAFNVKLNQLAIVKALSKRIKGEDYYLYNQIFFYKRKEFSDFLDLLEKGVITINFHIGICKSGNNIGKMHDRGTSFSIMEKDIPLLFNKI